MPKLKSLFAGPAVALALVASPMAEAQSVGELEMIQTFLALLTDYLEMIETTHDITSDAEKAAIMQMMKIQEVYEAQGNKLGSVALLQSVLDQTRNPAIRNAAHMMIGDTLKEAGQTDEALESLRTALDENIAAAD